MYINELYLRFLNTVLNYASYEIKIHIKCISKTWVKNISPIILTSQKYVINRRQIFTKCKNKLLLSELYKEISDQLSYVKHNVLLYIFLTIKSSKWHCIKI